MVEVVLAYDRSITPQETYYNCGPASCQVVLNGMGVYVSEQELASHMGTDEGGTDYVGLIENTLDIYVPDREYADIYLEYDPPAAQEKERLWDDIRHSIDSGAGVVMNWVAPPANYPVGVKGSATPSYGGGTVFHYVACMGYDDDYPGGACWIADSGFNPYGYWVSFDQAASLIPPKGYTYSAAAREDNIMADITREEFDALVADVKDIRTQLRGPQDAGWPQLGHNEAGDNLSVVDALAAVKTVTDDLGGEAPPLGRAAAPPS